MIKGFHCRKFGEAENPSKPVRCVRDEVQDSANTAEFEHIWVLHTNVLHYLEDKVMAEIWIFSSLLGILDELWVMGFLKDFVLEVESELDMGQDEILTVRSR